MLIQERKWAAREQNLMLESVFTGVQLVFEQQMNHEGALGYYCQQLKK